MARIFDVIPNQHTFIIILVYGMRNKTIACFKISKLSKFWMKPMIEMTALKSYFIYIRELMGDSRNTKGIESMPA